MRLNLECGKWVMATVVVLSLGCGCQRAGEALIAPAAESARQSTVANDLAVLGMAYSNHIDVHGQGPSGWEECLATAASSQLDTAAIERVRDLGYQVQWGVRFQDATNGVTNFSLATLPGNPTLMLDGSIAQ
jgi:hypothetical protein